MDAGYDVNKLSQHLDFIHLVTYDFHGSWESLADHHSPLYGRGSGDTFNSDYTVQYWLRGGAPAHKLVLGVPLYGRSWTLSTAQHVPPAPASGGGAPGNFTTTAGYLGYLEVCLLVNQGWTVVRDPQGNMGPYAYSGSQWVGYDDSSMAAVKADYIKKNGLAGAMVWALDLADSRNLCGEGR